MNRPPVGTITSKRIPLHVRRWEATLELGHGCWTVRYALTRRAAVRALKRDHAALIAKHAVPK